MQRHPFRQSPSDAFRLAVGLLAALFLLPSATTLTRGEGAPTVGHFEDWHGLEKVDILQVFHLADYRSIVVKPVVIRGAKLPGKKDEAYRSVTTILGNITDIFARSVGEEVKLPTAPGKAGGAGSLVIRARVIMIDPDSKTARLFREVEGGLAAVVTVVMAGEVIDGRSGTVLLRFEQLRRNGFSGDSVNPFPDENPYMHLLTHATKEIGNDVGRALRAF